MAKRSKLPGEMILLFESATDFGKQLVVDFKGITDINADLSRMARKGNLAAFFVEIEYSATVPSGGTPARPNYRTQRGCTVFASIEQPGLENKWWDGDQPLSKLHMASLCANLPFAALARYVPGERGEFPDNLIGPGDFNVFAGNGASESLNRALAWDAFVGPATCCQNTGGPIVQPIRDVYALVPCLASKIPSNDTIPTHYLSNDNNSVKLKIKVTAPGLASNPGPWAAGTAPVGTTATVRVWGWIMADRAEKDTPTVGLPWCLREQERPGPDIEMDAARSYRLAAVFPLFDSATTDSGVRTYYEPRDWPEYLETEIRWRTKYGADYKDDFPLTISSGGGPSARHVVDLWNQTSARGHEVGTPYDSIAPMVFPVDPARAHSVISDTIAGSLAWNVLGDGALDGRGFNGFIGRHSFAPMFPLALTSYVDESFPGFGDRNTACVPKIAMKPDTRPTALVTEIFTNPEAQKVILSKDTGITQCGCSDAGDGKKAPPIFLPALANLASPAAKDAAEMVPLVAINKFTPADAAKLKEAAPDVVKALNIPTPG